MGRLRRRLDTLIARAEGAMVRSTDEDIGLQRTRSGTAFTDESQDEFPVRITAVGTGALLGAYGWVKLIGRLHGTWVEGAQKGTLSPLKDPLWEANHDNTLGIGDVAHAYREEVSFELRTQARGC